jgi:hypothetical protein
MQVNRVRGLILIGHQPQWVGKKSSQVALPYGGGRPASGSDAALCPPTAGGTELR